MRLTFTGDLLCFKEQNEVSKTGKQSYDYECIFAPVSKYLQTSDYVCGSLETPIAEMSWGGYTVTDINFNTPFEFLDAVKKAGFDMLTTANNHCLDRGVIGLKNTIHALNYYDLDHTGTYLTQEDAERILIKKFSGVRVAFLSFTYGTNSRSNRHYLSEDENYMVDLLRRQDYVASVKISLLRRCVRKVKSLLLPKPVSPKKGVVLDNVDVSEISKQENMPYLKRFEQRVVKARELADLVILCLHSGGQFNFHLGVGEYTRQIVNIALSNGVDIIIGNHTHCVMPAKQTDSGAFVAYALGNFCFTPGKGYYVEGVYADYSVLLHIDIDPVKKNICDISFSVCKSVCDDAGYSSVFNVYDLYGMESDPSKKQELETDVEAVVAQFRGLQNEKEGIKQEYKFKCQK